MSIEEFLPSLACPRCGGDLSVRSGGEGITCTAGHSWPITDDMADLLLPGEKNELLERIRTWEEKRLGQGWGTMTDEDLRRLPFADPPGFPPAYWKLQREGYRRLEDFLRARNSFRPSGGSGKMESGHTQRDSPVPDTSGSPMPPSTGLPVLDLGAGTGWLAARVTELGYRVLAVDPLVRGPLGLARGMSAFGGRAGLGFAAASADHLPLADGAWGMVILNASLQVMAEPGAVLARLREVLVPSDRVAGEREHTYLLVMNTPLHADDRIDLPDGKKSPEPLSTSIRRAGFETVVRDRSLVYVKPLGRLVTGSAMSRLLPHLPGRLTLSFPWILLRPRP